MEEIKADYKQNYINYFTGEHKSAEFAKINPYLTVPAAVDGDLTITESVSTRRLCLTCWASWSSFGLRERGFEQLRIATHFCESDHIM